MLTLTCILVRLYGPARCIQTHIQVQYSEQSTCCRKWSGCDLTCILSAPQPPGSMSFLSMIKQQCSHSHLRNILTQLMSCWKGHTTDPQQHNYSSQQLLAHCPTENKHNSQKGTGCMMLMALHVMSLVTDTFCHLGESKQRIVSYNNDKSGRAIFLAWLVVWIWRKLSW